MPGGVAHCRRDALPLEVEVRGGRADLAAGQWVTATAAYDSQSPDDRTVPVLDAESVGLIEQPSVPYER